MNYFRVSFSANYCGGDEEIIVETELEDIEEDELFLSSCDEKSLDFGYEKFGCATGDFIDEGDEEEGLEPLHYFVEVEQISLEDIGDFDEVITLEQFKSGEWVH